MLPNGTFFPDDFDGDPGSVNLMFWRLQEHSNLTDLEIELRFINDASESSGHGGSCGTGSCSTKGSGSKARSILPQVEKLSDGSVQVDVHLSDAKTATTLASSLATSLAQAHLLHLGVSEGPWTREQWPSVCELHAIRLGFGALLCEASYMFSKGCGGVHVDSHTFLPVAELGAAFAIQTRFHEPSNKTFSRSMPLTPREAYDEGKQWIDSNEKVLRRMKAEPKELAADEHLAFNEASPWLSRVLGLAGRKKKSLDVIDEHAIAEFEGSFKDFKKAPSSSNKKRLSPDIRDLVDETFERRNEP